MKNVLVYSLLFFGGMLFGMVGQFVTDNGFHELSAMHIHSMVIGGLCMVAFVLFKLGVE